MLAGRPTPSPLRLLLLWLLFLLGAIAFDFCHGCVGKGFEVRLEIVGRRLDRLENEAFDGAFEGGSA